MEQQPFDLALVDRLDRGDGGETLCGMRLVDAPDAGDIVAVRGVLDVARAGELVALLTLLALRPGRCPAR